MTKLNQIYKCNVCGNIVEMTHAGAGQLVCCGEPMQLMEEKTQDQGMASSAEAMAAEEKHLPVIENTEKGVKVKVGSAPHPMEQERYIEWVEILFNGKVGKKFLNPGDAPEVYFGPVLSVAEGLVKAPDNIIARAYCNVHGLWKIEKNA
ncbi:MAG: desulfoferrodoxin [Candidatus Pacebacteria bacterium]|nr:desulfoferrodoxin [Candidatus Paceibacterota bacterium]